MQPFDSLHDAHRQKHTTFTFMWAMRETRINHPTSLIPIYDMSLEHLTNFASQIYFDGATTISGIRISRPLFVILSKLNLTWPAKIFCVCAIQLYKRAFLFVFVCLFFFSFYFKVVCLLDHVFRVDHCIYFVSLTIILLNRWLVFTSLIWSKFNPTPQNLNARFGNCEGPHITYFSCWIMSCFVKAWSTM